MSEPTLSEATIEKQNHSLDRTMHLQLFLPTELLVDETVTKVIAEAVNGEFCLLPRHIDFVATLVPGVLCFYTLSGRESYAAIDEGVLVKCGREVFVSTLNGVQGNDMTRLQALVEERFIALDEQERRARKAMARLETGTLRGFRDFKAQFHG